MVTTIQTLCVPTAQAAPAEPSLTWNKEANKPETQQRFFYWDFQRQEEDQGGIASREDMVT